VNHLFQLIQAVGCLQQLALQPSLLPKIIREQYY